MSLAHIAYQKVVAETVEKNDALTQSTKRDTVRSDDIQKVCFLSSNVYDIIRFISLLEKRSNNGRFQWRI